MREKVEKALAGLGVEAVNDNLVELIFYPFVDGLQDGLAPLMVNVVTLLERAAMLALLLGQAVHSGYGAAYRVCIPPGTALLYMGNPTVVGLPAVLFVLPDRCADVADEHMGITDAKLPDRILGQVKIPAGYIDDQHVMLFSEFIEEVDGAGIRWPAAVRQ